MSVVSDKIREEIRKRANNRCEYCRKPDKVSTYGYHVDHAIPLAHGGTSKTDNFAWACFECNVSKGRDISSYDLLTGILTPFFNPRTQVWDDHFEFKGALIVPKTAIGRVTVRILLLNHPDQVETRRQLMQSGEW